MAETRRVMRETCNSLSIQFSVCGEGTPILFLHGNPGTKDDFTAVSDLLGSKGYRFIQVDRPGHGNSQACDPEGNPDQAVEALLEFVKKICRGKAFIVGHSMGAFFGLRMAEKKPEMVLGLGLVAPFMYPRDPAEGPSMVPALTKVPVVGSLLRWVMPMLAAGKLKKHMADCFAPAVMTDDQIQKGMGRICTFESLLAVMKDKNDFLATYVDLEKKLKSLTCPILVIGGGKDLVCAGTGHLEKICQLVPAAHKEVIANAGHGLPMTHAREVADLLKKFLQP